MAKWLALISTCSTTSWICSMCGARSWKRCARTFSVWMVSSCASPSSNAPVAFPARWMAEQILPPSKGAIAPLRLTTEDGGRLEETDIGDPFHAEGECRIGRIAGTRNGGGPKRASDPTVHPARGRFVCYGRSPGSRIAAAIQSSHPAREAVTSEDCSSSLTVAGAAPVSSIDRTGFPLSPRCCAPGEP